MDMPLKIGVLILAHKNASQCERLIQEILLHPSAVAVLHIDIKSKDLYQNLCQQFKNESRVHFVSERYSVDWGSFNQIRATVSLLKAANTIGVDYCTLLSGQDFPIHPLSKFADFLNEHSGKQFIVRFALPDEQWEFGGMKRLEWFHLPGEKRWRLIGRLNGLIHRLQKLLGYNRKITGPFFGGSNWFNLSGEAVQWICEYLQQHPEFVKQFRWTRCADEIFIQTLVMRSPFADQIISTDLRCVDWSRGPEFPRIFRTEDLELLANQKEKFFARKFDSDVDDLIIQLLRERNSK
jgi:hypothetical protein